MVARGWVDGGGGWPEGRRGPLGSGECSGVGLLHSSVDC